MNIEVKKYKELQYVVRYPDNYIEGNKYPVIILLHGAGGRGDDINVTIENPYFQISEKIENFPFISVAPLCCKNTWFDLFEQLKSFALMIAMEHYSDNERIYLMGASMGGYGTWQLAMSMPEVFAAIAPICGGGMYWNAGRLVNVPVWAFHGKKDNVVLVRESEKMVEAVNNCGGNAKLTVYPDNEHNAWSDTYGNEEVYSWLLSHKNENSKLIEDMYKDSEIFG